MRLTRHEVLFLLVELVHDDVVTGNIQQRVVVLHQVQAVLYGGIHTKEMPGSNGNSLHGERVEVDHLLLLLLLK